MLKKLPFIAVVDENDSYIVKNSMAILNESVKNKIKKYHAENIRCVYVSLDLETCQELNIISDVDLYDKDDYYYYVIKMTSPHFPELCEYNDNIMNYVKNYDMQYEIPAVIIAADQVIVMLVLQPWLTDDETAGFNLLPEKDIHMDDLLALISPNAE